MWRGAQVDEIIGALEEVIGIDAIHQINWAKFQALDDLTPAEAVDGREVEAKEGQGCCQYLLGFLDDVEEALKKDVGFMVPPSDKWPKNNGFIRILPLIGYHRILYPQPGDLVVYTTGYVVEK